MRTTIDKAGRVVIPQAIRQHLRLGPGQEIEVHERDGRIEIEIAPLSVRLEDRGDGVVAVADDGQDLPPLTDEIVRSTLEQTRR